MEAAHLRYQIHNDEATGEAEHAEKERPGGSEEQQEEPRERAEHASHTPPESQANAQVQRGELQCGEAQCGEASTSTSASTKHADPPPTVVSVSCTVRAPDVDCIICYEQLATAPTSSLHCGHLFHKTCIDEWIEKDGRCPICRHQEREVARARPGDPADRDASLTAEQLELGRPDDEEPRPAHPWQLAALVISSHRLMALSAIEGLLSVVVMAYSDDVFFPLLMLTVRMPAPRQYACFPPLLALFTDGIRPILRCLAIPNSAGRACAPLTDDECRPPHDADDADPSHAECASGGCRQRAHLDGHRGVPRADIAAQGDCICHVHSRFLRFGAGAPASCERHAIRVEAPRSLDVADGSHFPSSRSSANVQSARPSSRGYVWERTLVSQSLLRYISEL